MNSTDYELVQALGRVKVFGADYGGQFPPEGKAAAAFARLKPLLKEIGEENLARGVPASPATKAKSTLLEELGEDLKAIARTARTIARDEPGFDTGFRLAGESQRDILASAEAFLERLEKSGVAEKFVAYNLPSDFVADLKADQMEADGLEEVQTEDRMEATGGTAQTRKLLQEGRELLKRLDTSVRNRFRHDPEVLAKWRAAARIHRAPRRPADAPPPSAEDGGGGDGTGPQAPEGEPGPQ